MGDEPVSPPQVYLALATESFSAEPHKQVFGDQDRARRRQLSGDLAARDRLRRREPTAVEGLAFVPDAFWP
jgi:hypothetical protein